MFDGEVEPYIAIDLCQLRTRKPVARTVGRIVGANSLPREHLPGIDQ